MGFVRSFDVLGGGRYWVLAGNELLLYDSRFSTEIASFSSDTIFSVCRIRPQSQTVVCGEESGLVHFLSIHGLG